MRARGGCGRLPRVADPLKRRGEWWQQQPDGGWLKWDESEARWEPQQFPPPPPDDADLAGSAVSPRPTGPDGSPAGALATAPPGSVPTPGFKYAKADDGTWWARDERTGQLHWHDVSQGRWLPYVDPASSAARTPELEGAEYGGFWLRVVAAMIDGIVVGVAFWAATWGLLSAAGETTASTPEEEAAIAATVQLVGIVVVWLYDALMESSSRQATLGKMAVGLRVTDMSGDRIGFGKATGRHFGKYLSALILGIGFLMVGWTRQKQGLHDQMAGTLVLKGRPTG